MPREKKDIFSAVAHSERTKELLRKLFHEARDPVRFAEIFLGWKPHPAQKKIMRTKARVYTIAAGRRFGKSEMMAVLALYYIFYGKGDVIIFAPSYRQTKIIFKNAMRFLNESKYLRDFTVSIRRSPYPEIEFLNGRALLAMSTHDYDMLRGYSAYVAILDEAAYIPDEAVTEVIEPMLLDKYGLMYKISTPVPGLKNHFYQTFKLGVLEGEKADSSKQRSYISFRYTTFDNPHIDRRALEEWKKKLGEHSLAWRVEILAEFTTDAGLLFPYSLLDALKHEYNVSINPSRKYILGVDFAKSSDYTAVVGLDVTERPARVVYLNKWHTNNWLDNVEKVQALAARFPNPRIVCDATGVGAPLYELLRKRGLFVEGYFMGTHGKQKLISNLKLALEQRLVLFPTNDVYPPIDDLIDELMYFQYKITEDGRLKLEAKKTHHDDYVIALALAVAGMSGVSIPSRQHLYIPQEEYDRLTWNITF